MKKFKSGVLVLSILFILTGCMKFNTGMNIKDDKSMDLSVDLKFSSQLLSDLLGDSQDELIDKIIQAVADEEDTSYIAQKIEDDEYPGVRIIKNIKNIDEISQEGNDIKVNINELFTKAYNNEEIGDIKIFKVTKGFLKDTYKADFVISGESFDIEDNTEDNVENATLSDDSVLGQENSSDDESLSLPIDIEDFGGMEQLMELAKEFEFTFNVNIPRKNISTNSENVSEDGKELKWNLTNSLMSGETSIQFEFDILNKTNIYMLVGGVLGLIGIIIIIVIIINSKKKKVAKEPIHTEFEQNGQTNNAENSNLQSTEISTTEINTNDVSASVDNTINQVTTNTNFVESATVGADGVIVDNSAFATNTQIPTNNEPQVIEQTSTSDSNLTASVENASTIATSEVQTAPVVEPTPEVDVAPTMVSTPVIKNNTNVEPSSSVDTIPTIEPVPIMETPVVDVSPSVEVPSTEESIPAIEAVPEVAQTSIPQPSDSYEFKLPEETASIDAQVTVTSENKKPMFVSQTSTTPAVEEIPVTNEINIEMPNMVDVNQENNQQ